MFKLIDWYGTDIWIKKLVTEKDKYGDIIKTYTEPIKIKALIDHNGGTTQTNEYGYRLSYTKKLFIKGQIDIDETKSEYGICIKADKNDMPDYMIKSISPYPYHTEIIAERQVDPDATDATAQY